MDTLTCSLYHLITFTSLYPFHFIVSMFSPLSFYLTSRSISLFPTWIGDLFILLHGGLSCHPFTHSIDIYSETFSWRGLCHFIRVVFIVPSCLEIRSFIAISVCLSLFHSVYAQKKKKTNKKQKKTKNKKKQKTKKKKKNKKNKKKTKKKGRKKKENIYIYIYI